MAKDHREPQSEFERIFGRSLLENFFGSWWRRPEPTPKPAPHMPRIAFCGNCGRLEATFNRALGALRDSLTAAGRLEDELRHRISEQAQMIAVLGHENEQLRKKLPPVVGV
jgi:truncated hemoglobin YjbI